MSKRIIRDLNAGFFVFSSLAVILITIIALMNYSLGGMLLFDIESTAEMVRVSDSNIFSFSDLKHLKAEAGLEKISAYSEMIALVSNRAGICKDGMKVVLVDEDYSSIYKYEMIEGRFPDEDSVRKGKAYAVISDQLALRLFMTLRVVGNEIEIMGEEYTIFGVYKSRSSVFWTLSGDGFDRVFIPYTAIDSYMELPVDIMALVKKQEQHINDTKIRIDAITGQKVSSYEINDYTTSGVVSHQYFDLLVYIIGLAAILFTIVFLARYAAYLIRRCKKKLNSYYAGNLLKTDFKEILGLLSVFIAGIVVMALIANMIAFDFIVADKYIPDDNIFDTHFYISAAMKDSILANSYKINIYSVVENYRRGIMRINIYCALLISVFIVISTMLYRLLLKAGARGKSILWTVLTTVVLGGALGVMMAILLGFEAYCPVKIWLLMLYYYYILLSLHKFKTRTGSGFAATDLTILK